MARKIIAEIASSIPQPEYPLVSHRELIKEVCDGLAVFETSLYALNVAVTMGAPEAAVKVAAKDAIKQYTKISARMGLIFNNPELIKLFELENADEMARVCEQLHGRRRAVEE